MVFSARSARRRPRRSLLRLLAWGAVAWVAAGVACLQLPPRWWWPLTFGGLTLPGALLLAAGVLVVALVRRRWPLVLLMGATLLLTRSYVTRGFALRWPPASVPPAELLESDSTRLRVLSYNVRIFNTYAHLADKGFTSSKAQIDWVAAQPADVLCLQEYYNEKVASRRTGRVFATTRRLSQGREAFVSVSLENRAQQFGMAIFSRYRVLRKGVISFGKLTQNHAMWIDVRLPGADTVRVYNVHFQSMSLEESAIVNATRHRAWLDAAGLRLLRRFRNGAVRRSWQADTLMQHVQACRYPVVVCGDFNDTPYSYTYQALADDLTNAHQAIGAGVGSTYNGRLPLLRIDNQFSSPDPLDPVWLKVHREVPYSDHFPLEVVYRLKR